MISYFVKFSTISSSKGVKGWFLFFCFRRSLASLFILMKYFWAWDLTWEHILVPTTSSIIFQFLPNLNNPRLFQDDTFKKVKMLRKFPSPFHRGRGGRGYKGGTVLKYLTMILRVIALVWEHFYYYRARGRKERKERRGRGRKGEGRGEGRGREEGRRDLLGRRNWKGGIFFLGGHLCKLGHYCTWKIMKILHLENGSWGNCLSLVISLCSSIVRFDFVHFS